MMDEDYIFANSFRRNLKPFMNEIIPNPPSQIFSQFFPSQQSQIKNSDHENKSQYLESFQTQNNVESPVHNRRFIEEFSSPDESSHFNFSSQRVLFPQTSVNNAGINKSNFVDEALNIEDTASGCVAEIDGSIVNLKSVQELPAKYRCIFSFPYFNALQSKVFDDVMYTDNPLVVCSPTGSGKTVLFELCIIRLLIRSANKMDYKIVYMAPIKALCNERFQDWNEKFSQFGLKCTELTGDTDLDDFHELQYSHVVFTTPEKWDSMTRKWKDHKSLVQSVRLFLIDEVHLLNDESRGATMEAVVSRMKTVQISINNEASMSNSPVMRFMAISATIPNVNDIASWLDTGLLPAIGISLGDEYRPVALRRIVLGYPFSERQTDFKFDLALNYKLSNIIQTYAENKPSLIFCSTRKSTCQAAGVLVKDARFIMNHQHKQRLIHYANTMHDSKLQEYVLHGIGFHHAGLDLSDRKNIEDMFTRGDLPVLFCTSTLAMGVNLPAHLVVIKGTMHYVMNSYVEYGEAQILQMIGRAGRPQFDTSATAVIMTKQHNKMKYQAMIRGTQSIESNFHHHLTEHINAEVVLGTIKNTNIALEWLKSTFLYKRMQENPKHYGAPDALDKEAVAKKMQAMCLRALKSLQSYEILILNEKDCSLVSTELGKLMARYCIAFDTVKTFSVSSGNESLEELVILLAKAKEFEDITIRQNERKILNTLNKDKNRITIRYPIKGKIKNTEMKVNCLLQAALGCLSVNEFSLNQDTTKIFRIGQRVSRFMLEFFVQKGSFRAAFNAILLCQCIKARLWENSKYVSRQIERIGPSLSSALVNAGITSFKKLEETNPRELEMIMNRHPPFGSQIQEIVAGLPKLDVLVEQDPNYQVDVSELVLTVKLLNQKERAGYLAGKKSYHHGGMLLVGNSENKVVFKQKLMDSHMIQTGCWSRKITVHRLSKTPELSVNYISFDYVGLNLRSNFTPEYRSYVTLKHEQTFASKSLMKSNKGFNYPATPTQCNHKCINKKWCGHECCENEVLARSNITSTEKKTGAYKRKSESYDMMTSAETPVYKASPMAKFCDDIQRKKFNLPNIQPLKKIKVELTLQQNSIKSHKLKNFEYTPRKLNFSANDVSNDYYSNEPLDGGALSQVTNFHTMRAPSLSKSNDSSFCFDDTDNNVEDNVYNFNEEFHSEFASSSRNTKKTSVTLSGRLDFNASKHLADPVTPLNYEHWRLGDDVPQSHVIGSTKIMGHNRSEHVNNFERSTDRVNESRMNGSRRYQHQVVGRRKALHQNESFFSSLNGKHSKWNGVSPPVISDDDITLEENLPDQLNHFFSSNTYPTIHANYLEMIDSDQGTGKCTPLIAQRRPPNMGAVSTPGFVTNQNDFPKSQSSAHSRLNKPVYTTCSEINPEFNPKATNDLLFGYPIGSDNDDDDNDDLYVPPLYNKPQNIRSNPNERKPISLGLRDGSHQKEAEGFSEMVRKRNGCLIDLRNNRASTSSLRSASHVTTEEKYISTKKTSNDDNMASYTKCDVSDLKATFTLESTNWQSQIFGNNTEREDYNFWCTTPIKPQTQASDSNFNHERSFDFFVDI